jgi:hypothetical protein
MIVFVQWQAGAYRSRSAATDGATDKGITMQLAALSPLAPATVGAPPVDWASSPLGSLEYTATLTHHSLSEVDDPDTTWEQEDIELWTERGTSDVRTTGVLGAREGYATLNDATKAMQSLTDDAVSDLDVVDIVELKNSAELRSNRAAAVLEHAGRFYGYAIDRDFAATEAFEIEPQVEDNALYDGATYAVQLAATATTAPQVHAIVDGYDGVWLLGR